MAFHVSYQSERQEKEELEQRVRRLLIPPLDPQGFEHKCTSMNDGRTVGGSVPMTPISRPPAGSKHDFKRKPLPRVPEKEAKPDALRSRTTLSKTPPTSPVVETTEKTAFIPWRQAPAPPATIPYSEQYPNEVLAQGQNQDGLDGGKRWFQALRSATSNGSLSNLNLLRKTSRSIGKLLEDMPDGPKSASQLKAEPELDSQEPDSRLVWCVMANMGPRSGPVASNEFQSKLRINHLPGNSYESQGDLCELEAIPPSPVNPLLDTKCLWCKHPSRNGQGASVGTCLVENLHFCFLFGSGGGREKYVYEQAGWLKGMRKPGRQFLPPPPMLPCEPSSMLSWYARGNTGGLSSEQLNDMAQLWHHLGRFFRPLKGNIEVKSHSINELANADIIEQWVSRILTMGPSRRIHPQETVESCLNRAGKLSRSIWKSDRVCSPFLWNALALAHPRFRGFSHQSEDPNRRLTMP
ncbi:F-box domain protein [Penicillium sp. IBT 35674x]|nr:F-box domain protein [Penicillium sp. IBT 35674x]